MTEVSHAFQEPSPSGLPSGECAERVREVQSSDPEGHEVAPPSEEEGRQEAVATLVWWSTHGWVEGTPWVVRHSDGSIGRYTAVRIEGIAEMCLVHEEDRNKLPDSPKGVLRLIEGTVLAGK